MVAAAAAALVFGLWYPWPYNTVAGGTELFLLLISVDVVCGPLLTLVVFDKRKAWSELRRDLAVIVLLQLGALGYGMWTVFEARPVALALEGQRFRVVSAISVVESELPQAPPALQTLSWDGPRLVATEVPTEGDKQQDAIMMGFAGVDIGMRPSFWQVWDAAAGQAALRESKTLEELLSRQPDKKPLLDAALLRAGTTMTAARYIPLLGRRDDWVVLINAQDGAVVGFAPLNGY
jgi:hypothetical protein